MASGPQVRLPLTKRGRRAGAGAAVIAVLALVGTVTDACNEVPVRIETNNLVARLDTPDEPGPVGRSNGGGSVAEPTEPSVAEPTAAAEVTLTPAPPTATPPAATATQVPPTPTAAPPTPLPTATTLPPTPAPTATAPPTPVPLTPVPPTPVPPTPVPPTPVPQPAADCTPGYTPCIPTGPDVDCAGGSGNGPRYVQGPIRVTGGDPYDLDRDNDGIGCD